MNTQLRIAACCALALANPAFAQAAPGGSAPAASGLASALVGTWRVTSH